MAFLDTVAKAAAYDKGLAEQSAKDAQAMAQFYAQQGAQLGFQEGVKQAHTLYAQNELQRDAEFNRMNYGADYSRQAPAQIPTGATTNGARLQPEPSAPTSSVVADYLAQKEAWRRAQSKGQ